MSASSSCSAAPLAERLGLIAPGTIESYEGDRKRSMLWTPGVRRGCRAASRPFVILEGKGFSMVSIAVQGDLAGDAEASLPGEGMEAAR